MMYEITPMVQDWYLEVTVLMLAGWALWKSIPREPSIDWNGYTDEIRRRLNGLEISTTSTNALMLLPWEQVQVGNTMVQQRIQRRLSDHIIVGSDALVSYWGDWLGLKCSNDLAVAAREDWMSHLETLLSNRAERFVIVAHGTACQSWLEFLHAAPAVRDFTSAIVMIEPAVSEDWISTHFNHDALDVEANVSIPYFVLSSTAETYLSTPPANRMGWKAIEVITMTNITECSLQPTRSDDDNAWIAHCISIMMSKRQESA